MKYIYLLFLLIGFSLSSYSQEPALPSPCLSGGNTNLNNMTISGTTTFTFNTLADFSGTQASNAITVTVKSSANYKLYIAGIMTSPAASTTNTSIPINTFTISSTNRGTSPATVTLSNSYLEVAQLGTSTKGLAHVLTITRNAMNTFTQAPGDHILTLHIRYCQY